MPKYIKKSFIIFLVIVMSISVTPITIFAKNISVWNGKTCIEPNVKSGVLQINSEEEFAWVLKHQNTKGSTIISLNNDLNMNGRFVKSLPDTIKEFHGNNHTISNMKIQGSGLFGDSIGVQISDLVLKNIHVVTNEDTGLLIGTLTGSSEIKNVKIIGNNLVATSLGHAGGFIGKIHRHSEKDRNEVVNINISNCSIETAIIGGALSEGKFIGFLNGYDDGEYVSFTNCHVGKNVRLQDFKPTYIAQNQACFLNDISVKYDGFIGDSRYYRGLVMFDNVQFLHKWDGKTIVEPLLASKLFDNTNTEGTKQYVVYTPFDLAGIREITDSPKAIYLKNSVDMNGLGRDNQYYVPSVFVKSKHLSNDDNYFKPFKVISTLDGKNHTIYNLSICETEKSIGAFILSAIGTTVHKNITFDNCQTVATHKIVKTNATAQGAILIANAGGSNYTAENITIRNCRVFALQKVGVFAGYVSATNNTINNCIVDNCYIENYKCDISETFDSGNKTFKGRTIRVKATFFPQGEVGGLIGFVQNNASITNCQVKNTKIYAHGQSDKMATISGSRLGKAALLAAGYYQVPGRHVGTFIGDIRTTKNVVISNCSVDSKTKCTNTWDKHNSTYNYIGRAYYVEFLDADSGSVKINNNKLILADCNKYTTR